MSQKDDGTCTKASTIHMHKIFKTLQRTHTNEINVFHYDIVCASWKNFFNTLTINVYVAAHFQHKNDPFCVCVFELHQMLCSCFWMGIGMDCFFCCILQIKWIVYSTSEPKQLSLCPGLNCSHSLLCIAQTFFQQNKMWINSNKTMCQMKKFIIIYSSIRKCPSFHSHSDSLYRLVSLLLLRVCCTFWTLLYFIPLYSKSHVILILRTMFAYTQERNVRMQVMFCYEMQSTKKNDRVFLFQWSVLLCLRCWRMCSQRFFFIYFIFKFKSFESIKMSS